MNNDCIELYQISFKNIPLNSWMSNEYFNIDYYLYRLLGLGFKFWALEFGV
jgi:hypothetical protein